VRSGVDLAIARLLPAGGPGADPTRVIAADDQCSAASAEATARGLVAEGVRLVVGHVCSAAAIAAAPIYAEAGVVFISPGARDRRFTDPRAGPGVFRLAGRSDRQAADIIAAIVERFPGKKTAIVNDQSPASRDLADAVHRGLTAAGQSVVQRESYTVGEKDYADLVRRLKISGAEVLFLPAQPRELVTILAQMRTQQLSAQVICSDGLAASGSLALTDIEREGVLVSMPWVAKPRDAAAERVQPLAQLHRDDRAIALQAYAAMEVWAAAVGEANSTEAAKVVPLLASKSFETTVGRIKFNERGDASIPSFALHSWSNGGWHQAGTTASR
jgi:branched-chain amino acid transport system substrate-binding protein